MRRASQTKPPPRLLSITLHLLPITLYMLDFIKEHLVLTCWLAFVALVYLFAWLDYLYYRYNLKHKAIQIYEAITEEE